MTGITAKNLGGVNNGKPGDVLVSYFKPLYESFDGPKYKDQIYQLSYNYTLVLN